MAKDRLAELQSRSQGKSPGDAKSDKEKKKLLSEENAKKFDDFLELSKHLGTDIDGLEEELESLHALHNRVLSQPLTPELAKELSAKTDDIHAKIKRLKDEVMVLIKEAAKSSKKKEITANHRILNEQAKRLTRNLLNVKGKFEKEQLAYKEKSKKMYTDYLRILGTDMPEEEIEDALQHGTLSQKIRGSVLACNQRQALHEVQQRTDGILSVEKSIQDLDGMFSDLRIVVVSQNDMLENIERNVDHSAEYVQQGKKQIKDALKFKRRGMKWKIMLIGGIIVLVLIVGGVILLTL